MRDETDAPEVILHFDELPFCVGARSPGELTGFPDRLPFSLYVDPDLAVPRLKMTTQIQAALEKAYAAGSMLSTPIGQGELSKARMDETVDKLTSVVGTTLEGKRFLEIGSGCGDLLNEIKMRGAEVVGCEIGPQGQNAADKYGIEVVRDMLRPDSFSEPFDCIYSYGCLEHLIDLQSFFMACRSNLRDGGLFFHAVPNSDLCFENLRLDSLVHQHVSYFTPENGVRLFESQGFMDAKAECGKDPKMFLWGYYDATQDGKFLGFDASVLAKEGVRLRKFADALQQKLDHQKKIFKAMLSAGQVIGFYAGGHVMSALFDLQGDVRFYDGDTLKHGKSWLAGLPPILAPETLREDPVDVLIICPAHHHDAIVKHLNDVIGIPSTVTIRDLPEI